MLRFDKIKLVTNIEDVMIIDDLYENNKQYQEPALHMKNTNHEDSSCLGKEWAKKFVHIMSSNLFIASVG